MNPIGTPRRRGALFPATALLTVALAVAGACTASGDGSDSGVPSPHVLAEGEFDGGSWRLVAAVDDAGLGIELRGSDRTTRGVGDYTRPYTLREAEAWVVPSLQSGDGFVTLVAGPVPDGVSPAVETAEGDRAADVEIVNVAGVEVFLATFEGAVRHFDVIARDGDGKEVGRETRQATYTRLRTVRPPKGDTWVLGLLQERHWDRAEIVSRPQGSDEGMRLVAWGEANSVMTGLDDGLVETAFIDRVAVHRGGSAADFRVTDGRFVPCADPWRPAGTSESPATDFQALPDLRLGIGAMWLAPWTELESIHAAQVEVEGEEVLGGRRTYRVTLTPVEREEGAQLHHGPRVYRWLVDAASGIVVNTDFGAAEPTPSVEIVALDDDVDPPAFSEIRFPRGSVSYEVQQPPRNGGRPRDLAAVYDRSLATSDGSLTLQDLVDEFSPSAMPIDCELRREPMRP